MTTWTELQDAALYDVPGCTYIVGARELREAAREFCQKSGAWRETLAFQALTANAPMQALVLEPDREVVKVLGAQLDNRDVDVLVKVGQGVRGVAFLNPTQFRIHPAPNPGQSIAFTVTLMPSLAATGMPAWFASQYRDALEQGAKARLFGTANQPFSNPEAAMVAGARFDEAINRAITAVGKAFSAAPQRTRAQFF